MEILSQAGNKKGSQNHLLVPVEVIYPIIHMGFEDQSNQWCIQGMNEWNSVWVVVWKSNKPQTQAMWILKGERRKME